MTEKNKKFLTDGVKAQLEDAAPNLSVFVEKELESMESTIYRKVESEINFLNDISIDDSDPEGAKSVAYKQLGRVGRVKFINASAKDLPAVGLYMEEFSQPVHIGANSFGWNYMDIKHAEMTGMSLSSEEAEAAREAHMRFLNSVTYFGGQFTDGPATMHGLLNHPDITLINAPVGGTTAAFDWANKNSAEIQIDVRLMVSALRDQSKNVYTSGFHLRIPNAAYDVLAMTPFNAFSDKKLLDFFLEGKGFGIESIEPRFECDEAALDGGGRAVMYVNKPEVLKLKVPMMPRALYELGQYQGLKLNIPFICTTAGVQFKREFAFVYMDGIA